MRIERLRERLHGYVRAQAWDAAEASLARWESEHPGTLEPALHGSRILLLQGRYRAAYAVMAQAVRQHDCPPELLLDVLLCLQEFSAGALLAEVVQRLTAIKESDADDLARAASVLLRSGLADAAARLLQVASRKAPRSPLYLINRAFLQFSMGDSRAAEATLESLIQGPQDVAKAHWLLSRLRRQTTTTNHVGRLRQRLSRPDLHEDDRAFLGFALFKELDDLGQFDAAWQALAEANAVLARLHRYDAAAIEQRYTGFKQQAASHAWPPPAAGTGNAQPTPIFIVGMHRSGSSLLEHLLSADPTLLACGETQRLRSAIAFGIGAGATGRDESFETLDPQTFDIAQAADHFFTLTAGLSPEIRFVTEKWPLNFQYVGMIRHIFRDARILHMRRDPLDLCFANFRERLGDGVAHPNRLADLAHQHNACLDLMAHWHAQYPGFILDVHYEDLVRQPDVQLQRVFAFCGMDGGASPERAQPRQRVVATPSALQVRQAIHTGSVGRCQRYLSQLEPLQRLLQR